MSVIRESCGANKPPTAIVPSTMAINHAATTNWKGHTDTRIQPRHGNLLVPQQGGEGCTYNSYHVGLKIGYTQNLSVNHLPS